MTSAMVSRKGREVQGVLWWGSRAKFELRDCDWFHTIASSCHVELLLPITPYSGLLWVSVFKAAEYSIILSLFCFCRKRNSSSCLLVNTLSQTWIRRGDAIPIESWYFHSSKKAEPCLFKQKKRHWQLNKPSVIGMAMFLGILAYAKKLPPRAFLRRSLLATSPTSI